MVGKNLSHYKILEELGRGGMGIVYKAEDTKLDRTVAIKVLPSAALASEEDRARFYREAKATAQLHHPHIAVVHADTAFVEAGGSFSPDGRFFAFSSNETGQDEVWVMEVSGGGKWLVSTSTLGGLPLAGRRMVGRFTTAPRQAQASSLLK